MPRDPKPSTPHTGPERRSQKERREGAERREEYRFELSRDNRRSGTDRRRGQAWDGTLLR